MPMNIREPIVAALEAIGEAFVIKAEQVHHGGLEIVYVDFVFSDAETQLVGAAVFKAALHAAAGHEE